MSCLVPGWSGSIAGARDRHVCSRSRDKPEVGRHLDVSRPSRHVKWPGYHLRRNISNGDWTDRRITLGVDNPGGTTPLVSKAPRSWSPYAVPIDKGCQRTECLVGLCMQPRYALNRARALPEFDFETTRSSPVLLLFHRRLTPRETLGTPREPSGCSRGASGGRHPHTRAK